MKEDIKPTGSAGDGKPAPAKIPPKADMDEPAFVPPEEIAAIEDMATEDPVPEAAPKKKGKRKLQLPKLSRKQWLIAAAVTILFIGVGGVYASRVFKKAPAKAPVVSKEEPAPEPAKPTTVPSKLSGVEVNPEINKLPVTAIMIENSPDARPQAGLKDASVVYEAIAEGGITRFLTLFLDGQPAKIGPVRSVRPYYLDFLMPYDAAIAHAGGSGQALAQIRDQGIKDLDHGPNGDSFQRSAERFAPHNLYTSFTQMLDLQRSKGFTSNTAPLARKKDAPLPTPAASSIDVAPSAPLYNSHWDYNATTNSYTRSMAGAHHVDENGGNITPKVIVVPVMGHYYEGIYSIYGTTGSGKVYIFQDGNVNEGVWYKAERGAQFSFKDPAGNPIALNPGQTWFTIISSPDQVAFRP